MKTFLRWLAEWNADPDTLYGLAKDNEGKGVTFAYNPEYDSLDVENAAMTHYAAFHTHRGSTEELVLGRTLKNLDGKTCAFWSHPHTENYKKAIRQLMAHNYIDGSYEVTISGISHGTADEFLGNKLVKTSNDNIEVDVPNYGKTTLHDIARLLHTLPPSSPQKQAIKTFICNNYKKYTFLANYVHRAECGKSHIDSLRPFLHQTLSPDNIQSMPKRTMDKLFSYYLQNREKA